jgi:hypothetical protein
MPTIKISYEAERKCGMRKKGGIYLVSSAGGFSCCKLPFPLTVCPHCSSGIKPVRGFTWINTNLFSGSDCNLVTPFSLENNPTAQKIVDACIMSQKNIKAGLLWVGSQNYPTAMDFSREAAAMGVSKRIAQIPKELKIGETWVMLAHKQAVVTYEQDKPVMSAGIFRAFKPEAIEYVIQPNDTTARLRELEKRGLTLVDVRPMEESQMAIPTMEIYDPADEVNIHKIKY